MQNLTIRKSVTDIIKADVPKLINDALVWMKSKYPTVNFGNVEYIFSGGYNRSRYFRNELKNAKYLAPNVCICTRATLYLYDKKSLGIKKRKLFVGSTVQIMSSLVHELTHHVQYETGIRKGNELDTTANELEYLKEYHLAIYNEIVKTK
jgi:hypothetical protein